MSRTHRLVVLAAVLVSACAGAAVSHLVIPPAHAAVTQRWEHLCFDGGNHADDLEVSGKKLSDAGREGWELATTTALVTDAGSHHAILYCLKRPAP